MSADPETPDLTRINQVQSSGSSAYLWGLWDISYNQSSHQFQVIPLRTADMTLNITRFIDGPPPNIMLEILNFDPQADFTDVSLKVGLKHPFPKLATFSGFDVMGVFLGNGSDIYPGEGNYQIAGSSDQQLLNADGYTRWFNAPEFSGAGNIAPIQGYTPGALGSNGYAPTAVINPYKYFADGLAADGDAFTHLKNYTYSRGIFRNGSTNYRNYDLRFPSQAGFKFQYAIIAHWEQNTNYPDPPHTPDDFPIEANAREAVAIGIYDTSTAYYLTDGSSGGNIFLDLAPIDWTAELNPDLMVDEYVINLYSPLWTGANTLDMTPVESGPNYQTFQFFFDVESLDSDDPIPLWIEVMYPGEDYTSPLGISNDADGNLAGYFFYNIGVNDFITSSDIYIKVLKPSDPEILTAGSSYEIRWVTENIYSNVTLEYSKDEFESDIHLIAADLEDTGSYLWENIPQDFSNSIRIRVSSVNDPEVFGLSDGYLTVIKTSGTWAASGSYVLPTQPYQDGLLCDITVSSAGENQSRAQVVNTEDERIFYTYNDDYSEVLHSWTFEETAIMKNQQVHWDTFRKFDSYLDGEWLFVTNNDDHQSTPPHCYDPMHGMLPGNFVETGAFGENSWGWPDIMVWGDVGGGGYPDADAWPWRYLADVASGVPGGWGLESLVYYIYPMSPLQDEPTGQVGMGYVLTPEDSYIGAWWNVNSGMEWIGNGLVDDSNPGKMALAVDNDTGLTIGTSEAVITFWILDSAGVSQPQVIPLGLDIDEVQFPKERLDDGEYGTATPIDIEIVPAKMHKVDLAGFNWVAELLDNGNGTWSVGVWEFNYEYPWNGEDKGVFHTVDITVPVEGVPQSLDVDCTDFEIHALYLNGSGQYAVDVLTYTP
ncbi:MAG TPA: hypothetical protein VGB30_03965 [bacterium]|jgi:hypothetical protein